MESRAIYMIPETILNAGEEALEEEENV